MLALQLVLPAAGAHVHALGLAQLVRAGGVPGDGGRRERARGPGARGARSRPSSARSRTALIADVATSLLEGSDVGGELDRIGERVGGRPQGAVGARIVLGADASPSAGGRPDRACRRQPPAWGRSSSSRASEPNLAARRRLLPALASLLRWPSTAKRLANEAFEAEALRRSRHRQDRGAAGGQPRPALAAHGHPGGQRRARGRDARAHRRRPPRPARHDRRRGAPARAGGRQPARAVAACRPARSRRRPRCGRSRI